MVVEKKFCLQKREEHNGFDAKKFSDWFHRLQFSFVGSIKYVEAVHGDELGEVVDECNVGIRNAGAKL